MRRALLAVGAGAVLGAAGAAFTAWWYLRDVLK